MNFFLLTSLNNYFIIDEEIFHINFILNKNLNSFKWILSSIFFVEESIVFNFYFEKICIYPKCKSFFSIFDIKFYNDYLLIFCDLHLNSYYFNKIII